MVEGLIDQFRFFLKEACLMCDCGCGCANPEKKVKDPKKCSPEQIAECHPESKGHPCEEKNKTGK